jgi:glycosyltransferase involved in cell wall biosynthesis
MSLTILQYITPSRLGGAERYFLKLVEELGVRGHRVIVVTKRDTPLRSELEALVASLPENARPELHFWFTRGKIDPYTLFKLIWLIKSRGVQVINTHLTTASWQGTLAGKITKTPIVAVVHATDRKTFFQWADHLVAVSGGVEEFLVEQGVPSEKIERLYCGLDLRDVVAVAPLSSQEAKKRLGLPEDVLTVGIAASLIGRKGHRYLLEALKILDDRGLKVHALFAGEGDQEAALRTQAQALHLTERVHFLGFRRDVHQVISAMDVFTLPSEKEGLSIAVMEAMAIGRPVVATRISGMDEVVRDGENGLLVPPCDAKALAEALQTLLIDPAKRLKFASCGKAYVENNFEQGECVGRVEAFFEKIAVEESTPKTVQKQNGAQPAAAAEPPLRVVQIIAPSKIAGAERSTIALCRGLVSRGNNIWLLVKDGQPMIGAAAREGVNVSPMRIGGKLNPFAVGRLLRWIRRHRVDIVATQLSTASLWGSIAAKILGVPCVATVRALNTKTCYILADRIIVVSEAVKKHLTDQGIKPEKIRVVYNGIDLKRFHPVDDIAGAKENVGFGREDLVVGVTAHLTRKKGHRSFLQAATLVAGQMPNVKFLLVGEGRERDALEAQVRAAGLAGRVIFSGFQDDVLPWMAAMDVLVLPTIEKEGFGRVLVEAGAMSKPVISTDIGGMAEVVNNGESGIIVPAGEVNDMADAMLRLLKDEELRLRMGRAGRARALARFSVEQMVASTEAVYREVWAERKAMRCALRSSQVGSLTTK